MGDSVLCIKVSYSPSSTSTKYSKRSMFNEIVKELDAAGYGHLRKQVSKGREFSGFVYFQLPKDARSREGMLVSVSEILKKKEKSSWMVFTQYTISSMEDFF